MGTHFSFGPQSSLAPHELTPQTLTAQKGSPSAVVMQPQAVELFGHCWYASQGLTPVKQTDVAQMPSERSTNPGQQCVTGFPSLIQCLIVAFSRGATMSRCCSWPVS